MKKFLFLLGIVAFLFLIPSAYAAGSYTESKVEDISRDGSMWKLKLAYTGDATDGSVPDAAISQANMLYLRGKFLYLVSAWPTAGGTAPDAADVSVKNANGTDLLGGKGVNLIPASGEAATHPYSTTMSRYYCPPVSSDLTVSVANQGTVEADFTIELIFVNKL